MSRYFWGFRRSDQSGVPPGNDEIKINLDGAFVPGGSIGGWGVVARDAAGHVIIARVGQLEHTADAFAAEVGAMAAAVATTADLGVIRVIFETDSQLLADALDIGRAALHPMLQPSKI